MPRPEPIITQRAWEDLDAVFDAVLASSSSVELAGRIYEGILSRTEETSQMPLAAPIVYDMWDAASEYRWVEHRGWLVFFHVDERMAMVVDRVLWGRSEWRRRLAVDDAS